MAVDDTPFMIEASGLTKTYGSVKAIDGITFNCHPGEIVGLLGPNGAGKTTTMRILTGYMPPTAGTATIAGFDTIAQSLEARRRLGYMPETVPLYLEMSVEAYLAYVGRLRRLDNLWERVDDALEAVDMLNRAETHIGKLSKGMRQRVGLAQAILHDPDVLILDEPTIGLDPAQIIEVRQLIGELGKRHTILLSTHILSEVEQLCSRVIIIIDGRIVADMPMDEVLGREGGVNLLLRVAHPPAEGAAILGALPGVDRVLAADGGAFRIRTDLRDETRSGIARAVVDSGWGLLELATERQTLEAIFLEKLREAETELEPVPESGELLLEAGEAQEEPEAM